jgi:ABC-type uncharacterized transport system auxiliary subunit
MNKNKTLQIFSLFLMLLIALTLLGCSKPNMPISVTYRKAVFDNSLVAQFNNNSDRYLTIILKFENKTLKQERSGFIEIAPRETKEIGWAEGWKFMSGEYITISHEDYATETVRMP